MSEETKPAAPAVTYSDNPFAPEFFCTRVAGVAPDGPNLRFTFASHRQMHDHNVAGRQPETFAVVCRIVMSRDEAKRLVNAMTLAFESEEPALKNPPPAG